MANAYAGQRRRTVRKQHQINAVREGRMHTRNPMFYNVEREDQGLYYGDKSVPHNARVTGFEVNYTPTEPLRRFDNADGSRTSCYNSPKAVVRLKQRGQYIDHRIYVKGRYNAPNDLPSWF